MQAMMGALVDILPETWVSANMVVTHRTTDEGVSVDEHRIGSEDGSEHVRPNDALLDASGRFAEVFRKYDEPWDWIVAKVWWEEAAETWRFSISFHYPKDVEERMAARKRQA
jgi:hypothetical protein